MARGEVVGERKERTNQEEMERKPRFSVGAFDPESDQAKPHVGSRLHSVLGGHLVRPRLRMAAESKIRPGADTRAIGQLVIE